MPLMAVVGDTQCLFFHVAVTDTAKPTKIYIHKWYTTKNFRDKGEIGLKVRALLQLSPPSRISSVHLVKLRSSYIAGDFPFTGVQTGGDYSPKNLDTL